LFSRYIGIDYSGAKTPDDSLKNLRVYEARGKEPPKEIDPPAGPKRYWTRKGVAAWLIETLGSGPPAVVGIDHGFSFPLKYFEKFNVPLSWDVFLEDFRTHWPTDEDNTYVDFVREGISGNAAERMGDRRWRRDVEIRARAKSVFQFDVQGQVAKSTHAGLPWLGRVRKALGKKAHFWPFDGWNPTEGVHVVAEAYPSLWRAMYPPEDRNADQQDAYAVSRWLQATGSRGELPRFFNPMLTNEQRSKASIEGWILGVG